MDNRLEPGRLLVGIPAMFYTALWNVREAGFLQPVMAELGITRISLLIDLDDYKPGGIFIANQDTGDFQIIAFDTKDEVKDIPVDVEVTGKLKPIVLLLQERKNLGIGVLGLLLRGQVKIRGIRKAFVIAKLLARCGIGA